MDPTTETPADPTVTPPAADAAPPVTDAPDTGAEPPADAPEAEAEGDEEPRPGSRAAQRIQELVAQQKRERELMTEYADFWRQRALGNGQPPAAAHPNVPADAPADDPRPSLDQFDSTEKWAAALTDWTGREAARQAAAAVEKTLSTREQQAAQNSTRQTYLERLAEFEQTTPNARATIANPVFSAVLERAPVITEVVMASEHGPALAHHLATNPVEADRISRMSPVQAAAAIGRIEARLAAAPPKPAGAAKPKISNAPPPPEPISGTGAASVDLSTVSLSEYVRIRGEQRFKRRR